MHKEVRSLEYRFVGSSGMKHSLNNESQMAGNDWVWNFLSGHENLRFRVGEASSFSRALGMPNGKVSFNIISSIYWTFMTSGIRQP
jgi:hypothetical protein